MSVKTVGQGIKVNLGNISGLRIFAPDELEDSIPEFPCALILHGGTSPDQAMGGGASALQHHRFRIKIAVAQQDKPSALSELLDYLANSGAKSVRAKIDADPTLNSTAQEAYVVEDFGQGGFDWGGILYLGTEFILEVWE